MKLWIGGEIEADVEESFRHARRDVQAAINDIISEKVYQVDLGGWDCIAIIRNDDCFDEICKYSKKTKEMDLRLKLDYKNFKSSSELERKQMLFAMLIRSLSILKEKGAIKDGLLSDALLAGKSNRWV